MTITARADFQDGPTSHARSLAGVESIRSANLRLLLRQTVFIILLTRSACDPIFGMSSADLGGSSITFGAAINALVIAIAALAAVHRPFAVPFAVFGIWASYLLVAFGATLYAPEFMTAARIYLVMLSYWAMFALPFFMFRSLNDLPRFILLIFASTVVPSLYAFWDLWHGMGDLSDFRLQSTFTHPNIFAFYLVLLLGLALYIRTSTAVRWPRGMRRLITMYIPVLLLFLAFTKTRSAWAACALMFLVYAVWFERRLLIGLVVIPILLSGQTMISNRLADLSGTEEVETLKEVASGSKQLNSFAWRQALWETAIPWIVEKPIVGRGLESFRPSTPSFFPLIGPQGIDAHNLYLQIAFEMGAIGILAYTWLVGSLVYWITKGFRHDPNGTVIVFTILAAYLLESYADNMSYYLAFNWYFMFAIGTICAWISAKSVGVRAIDRTTGRTDLAPQGLS